MTTNPIVEALEQGYQALHAIAIGALPRHSDESEKALNRITKALPLARAVDDLVEAVEKYVAEFKKNNGRPLVADRHGIVNALAQYRALVNK